MRLLGRRLFENAYQRQLERESDYRRVQDPEVIFEQLMKMKPDDGGRFIGAMRMGCYRFSEGFSIADVVESMQLVKDGCALEVLRGSRRENVEGIMRGSEIMLRGLIEHANEEACR